MATLTDILYIEDEPDIREVGKLALEAIGQFSVYTCESGVQALETLKHYRPQLILLDVMMPDMDGVATLQAIQSRPDLKNIPVIFMTAKVQKHEMQEYTSMGAIAVISKPFDVMTLSETVRGLWESHHA